MTKSLRNLTLFRQNFDTFTFFNVNDLYNAKNMTSCTKVPEKINKTINKMLCFKKNIK